MAKKLPASAGKVFNEIRKVISMGPVPFPVEGFGGNGAPGRMLEHILGIKENNQDSPDFMGWEVKFHGGKSLLTLFHKEPEPRGRINQVVRDYGWEDRKGRTSFRHTLGGKSNRGFRVRVIDGDVLVFHSDTLTPIATWPKNSFLNAVASKLRRLIVVNGKMQNKPTKQVTYQRATAYWDIKLDEFCQALEDEGRLYIDFDARTNEGVDSSIRNHGTKFRIRIENLAALYDSNTPIALP